MPTRLRPALLAAALAALLAPTAPAAVACDRGADEPGPSQRAGKKKRQSQPPVPDVVDQSGTIRLISGDVYGIVPDADTGTRYLPDSLADEFKKDGLRVVFSGKVGEIPPNVRMMGTPLTLTAIRSPESGVRSAE